MKNCLIKAYEVDFGNKYFVGKNVEGKDPRKIYLKDACMIKKEELQEGHLEEVIRDKYFMSEKGPREFLKERLVNTNPIKFTID